MLCCDIKLILMVIEANCHGEIFHCIRRTLLYQNLYFVLQAVVIITTFATVVDVESFSRKNIIFKLSFTFMYYSRILFFYLTKRLGLCPIFKIINRLENCANDNCFYQDSSALFNNSTYCERSVKSLK